jgi:hypothetical protein
MVMCQGNVISPEEYQKKGDEAGRFRFRGLFHWSPPGQLPAFAIVASKDGYTGAKTTHLFAAGDDGTMRLEDPLVLRPGFTARVQVLGDEDQPLEGAWAELSAADYQNAKSDSQGLCTLRNLPAGETPVRFSYGELSGSAKIAAGPDTETAPPVVVRLRKGNWDPLARPSTPKLKRVAVGEQAPEWSIRQWSDHKQRSLSAMRGRIVVIEFWDISCRPCREITMPVHKALSPKYAKDVTFLYIHPAIEEAHLVQQVVNRERWDIVVGLDEGTERTDSVTLNRYGVGGCLPWTFIIDRQGRILDNDDMGATPEERLAKSRVLAKETGLPWPLDKDASEGELVRRMRRFHEHWMTKRIEAALRAEE